MTRSALITFAGCIALLTCSACGSDIFATHNTPSDLQQGLQAQNSPKGTTIHATNATPVPTTTAAAGGNYASDGSNCNATANSRMSMYDRPSTYPISDQERHDAYLSLYSECMREHNWQVAGPVRAPATMASNASAAQLANLSPAAGGNYPGTTAVAGTSVVSSSSVPGATVVVIGGNNATASQLSSLSPSAGGNSPNATVVLVQSPQATTAPGAYYPPAAYQATLPVAQPIAPPPMARAYAPVAQPIPPAAIAPTQTMAPSTQRVAPAQNLGYQPAHQPTLASADASLAGNSTTPAPAAQSNANQQLEAVLEK